MISCSVGRMEWITQTSRTLIEQIGRSFYKGLVICSSRPVTLCGDVQGIRYKTTLLNYEVIYICKYLYMISFAEIWITQTALLLSVHISNKKSLQSLQCVTRPEGS